MAKTNAQSGTSPQAKPSAKKPASEKQSSAEKSEIVDVVADDGDHVEPPPPEEVEPDPELSPEEAEQARKDYLLTRFWISARGYWGRGGDRLAWVFSIGLLILIVAMSDSSTASMSGTGRSSTPSRSANPRPYSI